MENARDIVSRHLQPPPNNALVQTFTVNGLNQATNVSRSGTFTVAGGVSYWTSVTVNGSSVDRVHDDLTFSKAGMTLTNGANSFTAIIGPDAYGRNHTNTVSVTTPTSIDHSYDSNGNLTSDGTRSFTYDDENQLTKVEVTNSWKVEYAYDESGRRRTRKEYSWAGSAWSLSEETRYVYDGMLVIHERNGSNTPTVSYTRGLDLSGTLDGAGGVGGLIARTENTSYSLPHSYYHHDGNGNVIVLVNAQKQTVARYLYEPFGTLIGMSGWLAEANPYRFSGKEFDDRAGLYYYGFRFYEPNLQRWLNQDPLGEAGDLNLYGFSRNSPINVVDRSGLDVYELRRTAQAAGGSVDHTFVFIEDTGLKDKAGRPINYVVNFDKNGEVVLPTRYSLDEYLKNGVKRDPDLRISQKLKTLPEENEKLVDYFKRTSPSRRYNDVFNNCRTTYNRATYFIIYTLRNPDFVPDVSIGF